MADKALKSLKLPGIDDTLINTPPSTATDFDVATAYAVGDIVFNNTKLYKFIVDHPAGAWNNAHVTEITVGGELSTIYQDLSDLGDAVSGKYTKPSGGIPASDLASGVIPEVPVTDVQTNGTSVLGQDGVANIPTANTSTLGVIRTASGVEVQNGTAQNRAITPYRIDYVAFYGLAKASGDSTQASSSNSVGNYTETAKSKIHDMLDAPVTVSGTTPTIIGKSGIRYICGEVSTLSITPPASGDMEVIFESGSTATVLTVPNTVKFPAWFDPTDLESDCIYDIIITDGIYGVVASWA